MGTLENQQIQKRAKRDPDFAAGFATIRTITSAEFKRIGTPSSTSQTVEDFDFFRVTFESKGFLNQQVRRMIGFAFAIASGRSTLDDLNQSLVWNPRFGNSPPYTIARPEGLSLQAVEYDPEIFLKATDDFARLPVLPEPSVEFKKEIEWKKVKSKLAANPTNWLKFTLQQRNEP